MLLIALVSSFSCQLLLIPSDPLDERNILLEGTCQLFSCTLELEHISVQSYHGSVHLVTFVFGHVLVLRTVLSSFLQ